MKLTQGAFSFLPDLTDEQITKQIQYSIDTAQDLLIAYWICLLICASVRSGRKEKAP
jgi:hypothetical protein